MNNESKVDDIVSMIDAFMNNEGGHMNIAVSDNGSPVIDKNVQTTKSLDCCGSQMACQVPTLHEGLDEPEER
ncbi:MAG: hypothetical protein ACI4EV_09150 [Lachnospiraceae bacterium]